MIKVETVSRYHFSSYEKTVPHRAAREFVACLSGANSNGSDAFAGESRPKKGKPATAEMQPAGLNLYPLPQGRLHKSTLNEIWQDQGVILLLLTGLFCHSAAYDGALTRSFKGAGAGGDFKEGKKMPAGSGQSEGTEVRSLSVQTAILDIGSARGTIFVPLAHRQYEADDAGTKTAAAKK